MKKGLSPGIVVLIIAIAVIILGAIYWHGASPAKNQKAVDAAIGNTMLKPDSMPTPAKAK